MMGDDDTSYEFVVEAEPAANPILSAEDPKELKVRLDKWLWAARFYKTRALARIAIEEGRVLYNDDLVKPNIEIELGAEVVIHQNKVVRTVIVQGLSTRRRNAVEAEALYKEVDVAPEGLNGNKENYQPTNYAKEQRKNARFLRSRSHKYERNLGIPEVYID